MPNKKVQYNVINTKVNSIIYTLEVVMPADSERDNGEMLQSVMGDLDQAGLASGVVKRQYSPDSFDDSSGVLLERVREGDYG